MMLNLAQQRKKRARSDCKEQENHTEDIPCNIAAAIVAGTKNVQRESSFDDDFVKNRLTSSTKRAHRTYTIQTLQEYAEAHSGRCLSTVYTTITAAYEWSCQEQHTWSEQWRHFTTNAEYRWCRQCAEKQPKKKKRCVRTGTQLLREARPDLFELLHPEKNAHINVHDLKLGSGDVLWWTCKTNSDHLEQLGVPARVKRKTTCVQCDDDAKQLRNRVVWDAAHPQTDAMRNSAMICRIPLHDGTGSITEALCDEIDYAYLTQFSWTKCPDGYAHGPCGVSMSSNTMHRLIMNGCEDNSNVIDHINNNRLDNRRTNLREVSRSQNAQNTTKRKGCSSQYRGVSLQHGHADRWVSECAKTRAGVFKTEHAAAFAYDQLALSKFGPGARINGVPKPPDFDQLEWPRKTASSSLPFGVRRCGSKFQGQLRVDRKLINLGTFATQEEASRAVDAKREELARKQRDVINAAVITRNPNGDAIITTNKGEHILVDEDAWRDLFQTSWYINIGGYAESALRGLMHRYIVGETDMHVMVDHINTNKTDNRKANLRRATAALNGHNRVKRAAGSSQYTGVSITPERTWKSGMAHEHVHHYLGTYRSEVVAAWVRDQFALEIYGTNARLNGVAQPTGWTYRDKRGYLDEAQQPIQTEVTLEGDCLV
jgi:hypothetical protein